MAKIVIKSKHKKIVIEGEIYTQAKYSDVFKPSAYIIGSKGKKLK